MADHNAQLATLFQQMADVLEITGGNRFRVLAFQKAARALAEQTADVADMDDDELGEIDGIGKGMVGRIREYLDTGRIEEHQKLMEQVPAGLLELLDIPGMGPKTVATFWQKADVTDLNTLKKKLETGELAKLPGFGQKKIENIRKSLAFAAEAGKRARLGDALPLAQWFVDQLRKLKSAKQVAYAGSLRRGKETIGDVDLLVAARQQDAERITDAFVKLDPVSEVIARGKTKTSVRTAVGMQVDLRIIEPDSYGAAMLYFTGSKEHNVRLRERANDRGMTLNEYALSKLKKGGKGKQDEPGEPVVRKTEEQIYKALELTWIPPELREDRGEIDLAEKGELPELIERDDIKAELHAHTTASDGHWSIRQLAQAAADRGFHTVAVTDHSRSQIQANGLSAERLERHIEAVREVADEMKGKITVLAGSEVDILADGRLDYPNSLLKELDLVVASPHGALSQEPAAATKRFLKAIENPYVTIIGHLTGRLINRREGLRPDLKAVLKAAGQRGIAMELNANHYRLDLRDTHARAAIKAGVMLSINTDAHGPADLDELRYGVLTARRAGATKKDVINCMSKTELAKWIKATRS